MPNQVLNPNNKKILTLSEIKNLIEKNRYSINETNWFLSRCIDGRYDKKNLEPLAKPGADIGDLMTLFAANRQYNLGLKNQDIFNALIKTVGNYQNLRFHTDSHNKNNFFGCGHFKQAKLNPEAYYLTSEDISAINKFLLSAVNKKAKYEVLLGEHNEGAVIILKGDWWSVSPVYKKKTTMACFVYHKTLDDRRRRLLVKNLLSYYINIKLSIKIDVNYLCQILTKTANDQLLETVSRLAPNLPIYEVKFTKDGSFEMEKNNS